MTEEKKKFGSTILMPVFAPAVIVSGLLVIGTISEPELYERLPFSAITSFLTVILIITFFVTSSDSGSLVIDSLASGCALHTPAWRKR